MEARRSVCGEGEGKGKREEEEGTTAGMDGRVVDGRQWVVCRTVNAVVGVSTVSSGVRKVSTSLILGDFIRQETLSKVVVVRWSFLFVYLK